LIYCPFNGPQSGPLALINASNTAGENLNFVQCKIGSLMHALGQIKSVKQTKMLSGEIYF